ncbi:MAG: LuxR C-terminal-related transcriptional regulator [Nevskia sp.]|nr:LuxR C-terminal-related transcriptional regulator [Nevskia sp.]
MGVRGVGSARTTGYARQRPTCASVAHGLSFKQAAKRIGIAPSTVANHLSRVYRKLGVYSRNTLAGRVYPSAPQGLSALQRPVGKAR